MGFPSFQQQKGCVPTLQPVERMCASNVTQTRVTREVGTMVEKMPSQDWATGKPVGRFLNN